MRMKTLPARRLQACYCGFTMLSRRAFVKMVGCENKVSSHLAVDRPWSRETHEVSDHASKSGGIYGR